MHGIILAPLPCMKKKLKYRLFLPLFFAAAGLLWIQCAPLTESKFDVSQESQNMGFPVDIFITDRLLEGSNIVETFTLDSRDIESLMANGEWQATSFNMEEGTTPTEGNKIVVLETSIDFQGKEGEIKLPLQAKLSSTDQGKTQLFLQRTEANGQILSGILPNDAIVKAHIVQVEESDSMPNNHETGGTI